VGGGGRREEARPPAGGGGRRNCVPDEGDVLISLGDERERGTSPTGIGAAMAVIWMVVTSLAFSTSSSVSAECSTLVVCAQFWTRAV
jgi:hypothetical protein